MSRVAYVNGRYVDQASAAISVMDRGFLFADSVYEVVWVKDGRLVDLPRHLDRLDRSMLALSMGKPLARTALKTVLEEVRRRNRLTAGAVYLQVTRGAPRIRDHAFPPPDLPMTMVCFARRLDERAMEARAQVGVQVITRPDDRWGRCDIKSTALLANVLAKQAAAERGAAEAWYVDAEGCVTEGASSNAWIVDATGRLRTRDLGANILPGVTRAALMDIAAQLQLSISETPFSVAEAQAAREAFNTSAMAVVTPVIAIDGRPVGDGAPGPVTLRLRTAYTAAAGQGQF